MVSQAGGGTGRKAEVGSSTSHLLRACPQGAHSLGAETPNVLGWGKRRDDGQIEGNAETMWPEQGGAKQRQAGACRRWGEE